jgi:predicted metalloprotease with PDZ domain
MPSRRVPLRPLPIVLTVACLLGLPAFAAVAAAAAVGAEPRPIELAVDATDAPRGIFHSRLVIPAAPGPLTLAYPKWIQGEHAPTGPVMQVAGFTVAAGGRELAWHRDPADMFLVHVEVPAGAAAVEVSFDYLSPVEGFGLGGYGETPNATPHLAIVDWHDLLVYPLGPRDTDVLVRASLRLPPGWQWDTALAASSPGTAKNGAVSFAPTSLYTLIDSPVLAGEIFRTIELAGGEAPVHVSFAADRRSSLAVPEARIAALKRVPAEALALFGAHHYRSYRWLVAMGDTMDHNGLEHHQSSDDRGEAGLVTDDALLLRWGTLLPHEYVHSWNGKYRRPAGLAVRDTQQALDTELLWVYEGLTRYLGDFLLTTRSGIRTAEQSRDYAAWVAATQDHNRPGRKWRPLVDTARSVWMLSGAPTAWNSYRRALDYYDESMLIWLEADAVIREKSGGARSLDDFCRSFYGGESSAPAVVPYAADDVYAALAKVTPYDWKGFFAQRIYAVAPRAPLGGLAAAGWRLVYNEQPNSYQKARAETNKQIDESFSVGLWVRNDGTVDDVVMGSPAWEAGLGPGMKLIAVGGRAWTAEVLPEEIRAAKGAKGAKETPAPIEIAAQQGDVLRTFRVAYHDGERHPHLERDAMHPDLLGPILAPKTW